MNGARWRSVGRGREREGRERDEVGAGEDVAGDVAGHRRRGRGNDATGRPPAPSPKEESRKKLIKVKKTF